MKRLSEMSTLMVFFAAAFIIFMASLSKGWGSALEWKEVGPSGGGGLPDFSFDPVDPDKIYITSNMVGVFASDDAGDHWRWSSYGGSSQKGGIAVDPRDSNILYAVGPDGIYQSTDKAKHWQLIYTNGNNYEGINNLKAGGLSKTIFGKPGNPVSVGPTGIVYVCTEIGEVVISRDKGRSFMRISVGGKSKVKIVIPVDEKKVVAGLYREGIYLSRNGGDSWENTMPVSKGGLLAVAIHPTSRNVLYALVSETSNVSTSSTRNHELQLYKSLNGGESWNAVHEFKGLPIIMTRRMMDVSKEGTIIILTSRGPIRSTDAGLTWSSYGKLVTKADDDYIYGNKGRWEGIRWSLYADYRKRGRWYMSGLMAVFRSDDDGWTWHYKVRGLREQAYWFVKVNPDNPNIVIASDLDHGLIRSTDNGKTWRDIVIVHPYEECDQLRFSPNDTNHRIMYALFKYPYPFIAKSTDQGETWNILKKWEARGRRTLTGFALIKGEKVPIMYVGEPGFGILMSKDEGRNWMKKSRGLPNGNEINYIHALESDMRGYLYVGISSTAKGKGGMLSSTDGGENWLPINHGLGSLSIRNKSFEIDPNDPDILWVSSGRAVYRSVTCGRNWEKRIDGLYSSAILVEPGNSNIVYVAVYQGGGIVEQYTAGIYKSVDGGNYFFKISGDLFRTVGSSYRINDLEYSWRGPGGIWAAPNGGGIIYTISPFSQDRDKE